MINKITCEYIDDKTNEKTLTHDLSKMTKAKFKSVNRYFAFVEQYTGITEPRNRDIFKKTITDVIQRHVSNIASKL